MTNAMGKAQIKAVIARVPKDPLKVLASQHEEATIKLEHLRAQHVATFASARALETQIGAIEEEIKPLARAPHVGKPAGMYEVFHGETTTIKATAKYSDVVNAAAILAAMPELRNVPGLFVSTMDPAMLAILIKNGTIPAELAAKNTIAKQSTTAIQFRRTEAAAEDKLPRVVLPALSVVRRSR